MKKLTLIFVLLVVIVMELNAKPYVAFNASRLFGMGDGTYKDNLLTSLSVGFYRSNETFEIPPYGEVCPTIALKTNLLIADGKKPIPAVMYSLRTSPSENRLALIGSMGLGYAFGKDEKGFTFESGVGFDIPFFTQVLQIDVGYIGIGDINGFFARIGFAHR